MTAASPEAVADVLKAALLAVEVANIPTDLRPVAFTKAAEMFAPVSADPPAARQDTVAGLGGAGQNVDERLARIAKRMGVEATKLPYIYEADGEGVILVVPRSKLPSDKTNASREVALLYAAARQAGGYDDGYTSGADIRERVLDMGVFDPSNFAAKLATQREWFAMRGKGQKREFKVSAHGFEEAGKIVNRIRE